MIPNLGEPTLVEFGRNWFRFQSWEWFCSIRPCTETLDEFVFRMGWPEGDEPEPVF